MPQHRMVSAGICRAGSALAWAPAVLALVLAIWSDPAVGRPAPDLERMDLTVRPADVAAPPKSVLDEALPPFVDATNEPAANQVDEVDKVRPNLTPNKGPSLLGPLGDLGGQEGGALQELLENKTIPLFRVRMKSPL